MDPQRAHLCQLSRPNDTGLTARVFDQSRRKFDLSQNGRPTRRLSFLGGEEEASMLRRVIGHESRGPPQWHLIVTQVREYRWTEIDPGVHTRDGEHPLEAMMHFPGQPDLRLRARTPPFD